MYDDNVGICFLNHKAMHTADMHGSDTICVPLILNGLNGHESSDFFIDDMHISYNAVTDYVNVPIMCDCDMSYSVTIDTWMICIFDTPCGHEMMMLDNVCF